MSRPRTKEEIITRIKERQPQDTLCFEFGEYLRALKKDEATELIGTILKDDADMSDWEADLYTKEQIIQCCKDYMEFAWEKANNCRGISANRSIMHYIAWLWLLGTDEFDDLMDDYEYYGKPQLERICSYLEIDYSEYDDKIRTNTEY